MVNIVLNIAFSYWTRSQTQTDWTGHVFTDLFTPCSCLFCVQFILITEFYIIKDKQMDWTGLATTLRPRVPVFLLILLELLVKHTHSFDSEGLTGFSRVCRSPKKKCAALQFSLHARSPRDSSLWLTHPEGTLTRFGRSVSYVNCIDAHPAVDLCTFQPCTAEGWRKIRAVLRWFRTTTFLVIIYYTVNQEKKKSPEFYIMWQIIRSVRIKQNSPLRLVLD